MSPVARNLFIAVILALVVCTGVFLMRQSTLAPSIEVSSAKAAVAPIGLVRSDEDERSSQPVVGVVFARQAVDITPRFQGVLEQIHVQIGQRVQSGDSLATLESESIRQQLKGADAALKGAQATELKMESQNRQAVAQRDHRKEKPLGYSDVEQEEAKLWVEQTEADVAVAQANVTQEEARISVLKQQLADAELKAPFDGVVAARFVDPGALVGPGNAILRLISEGNPWVRFAVAPDVAESLREESHRGKPTVVIRTDEGKSGYSAVVENIAPEVDSATELVLVEARLEVPADRPSLTAGTVVQVDLIDSPHH